MLTKRFQLTFLTILLPPPLEEVRTPAPEYCARCGMFERVAAFCQETVVEEEIGFSEAGNGVGEGVGKFVQDEEGEVEVVEEKFWAVGIGSVGAEEFEVSTRLDCD